MFKRLLTTLCARRVSVQKQQTRSSAYFCFDTAMPIVPACYWSTLPNGFRVVSEQTTAPLACVTLLAEAGSRFETDCNNGACHFFEHMAYRGLCTLQRCLFQETVREMGAYMTAHTDREYQAFICLCPHECVNQIINLFSRMFYELDYNPLEVECAKQDILIQLQELDENYKMLTFDNLHQTAFQGTTLARAPVACLDNYKRFDLCFLQAFVAQHYQPFRLILSVSSCYSHHDIVCRAQCDFGSLKQTTNDLVDWPCRFTGSMISFRNDDLPYCHIALAVETGGYYSKDFIALQLMKHILGKWDESQCQGYNTWPMLAHACSVSRLCHRYQSFYIPYRDVGLWGVYFVIKKKDDFENAVMMIQDQWMYLATSTTFADVERAASSLKLELAKSVDGCQTTCLDMGLQLLYTGHRKSLLEQYEEVDSLKQMEIRDVASRLIYDRCPAVSAVGPTEAVPEYNRFRAGTRWLRF